MTKEEFYSNIREYKARKSLKHGNDPEVWERDSFDFAVAALTKTKLAKFAGQTEDASRFESEYNGYMNKLAHMDERAAKALEQKVLASAEAKYQECRAKLLVAQHSNEPLPDEDYLEHHGILGQKWGVRRYQNTDGTLTSAGKKRYSQSELDEIAEASRKHGLIGGFIKRHQIKKRHKLDDPDQYDNDDYDGPKTNVEKVLDKKLNKNPNSIEKGSKETEKLINELKSSGRLDKLLSKKIKGANKDYSDEELNEIKKAASKGGLIGGFAKMHQIDKSKSGRQYDNEFSEKEKNDIREKTKFPDSISEKVSRARATGKYDIDFVEKTQNSEAMETDQKLVDREYKKFLQNPSGYKYTGR